jgi:hypothetical protein
MENRMAVAWGGISYRGEKGAPGRWSARVCEFKWKSLSVFGVQFSAAEAALILNFESCGGVFSPPYSTIRNPEPGFRKVNTEN